MRVLAPLLLVLAAACATSGSDPVRVRATRPPSIQASGSTVDVNISHERAIVTEAIRATPEVVWGALRKAYADLGIEVTEASDASRVLGNPRLMVSRRLAGAPLSRYLECGAGLTGPFADRYRIEMLIRSAIVPGEGGGARVDTYVEAVARNPEGTSNTAVACGSTQRLEREIAARVRFHAEGG
ncbi:MAG: hypothetical protein Q8N53_24675 [Longimicrobiales bacterium]|nr:hypothetical protein [Longimicrobiales bacterium]